MSESQVAVLNAKLDILIDDFKSFKRYVVGFVITIMIPIAVYVANTATTNKRDIAVIQEKVEKAVTREDYLK